MITFAAFTPHTPFLLPTIGKQQGEKLAKTQKAMEDLSDDLYASYPDVLVILSSHAVSFENVFSVNLHDSYLINFKDFGDLATTKEFTPDLALIAGLQRHFQKEHIAHTLYSKSVLDYGASVPLYLLTRHISLPIVPISPSGLDAKAHFAFGKSLQAYFLQEEKRIAICASGDLSHALSAEAPAGFHQHAKIFDEQVRQAICDNSSVKLLHMEEEIRKNAQECGFKTLLILMGILENLHLRAEECSYEAPFGIGHLVAQFHLL